MQPENPPAVGTPLIFAEFDAIVRGTQPLPDNLPWEILERISTAGELLKATRGGPGPAIPRI
jgi:hypothetical protein